MKQIALTFSLSLFSCLTIYGQKLTLQDLTTLCGKNNWEDVNQSLVNKKWTFYDSEKGDTYKYNTITWSFNKDLFSDKAQAWFHLYTYEGYPNKVSYSVFNKESYSLIQNSISSSGFKLVNSEIEDNYVVSTYGNSLYTLEISTEKRTDDDWSNRSTTAYRITIIKKAGIYDLENGKKTDYYYDDVVNAEYTLQNGKLNGQLKVYYLNGQLKKIGNYSNGEENGLFKEYDENGELTVEYPMKKGKKNGVLKFYESGKIDREYTFKDDVKNGQSITYYYDEESGELQFKLIGDYLEDEKNGTWNLFYFNDNKEILLTYQNFVDDIKEGQFQEIKGDSLIIGNYKNDKLHGVYKVYLDVNRLFLGGMIRTNIAYLKLLEEDKK